MVVLGLAAFMLAGVEFGVLRLLLFFGTRVRVQGLPVLCRYSSAELLLEPVFMYCTCMKTFV